MKTFRKLCAALVLSAALILPAFAGETQFPGQPPGPSSNSETIEPCVLGETQFPGTTSDCETIPEVEDVLDPTTGTILTMLEGLLSLF